MGKRTNEQAPMWVSTTDLPVSPGHPFYARLNAILDEAGFDRFAEEQCRAFYAPAMGRPSLPPGRYFRLLLLGYFASAGDAIGRRRRRRRLRSTPIAGACAGREARESCDGAANTSSAPSPTCTTPADSAGHICGDSRTSSSGCSSTPARSISVCSCGRRSGAARREGCKDAGSALIRSKLPSPCSSSASGRPPRVSGAPRG